MPILPHRIFNLHRHHVDIYIAANKTGLRAAWWRNWAVRRYDGAMSVTASHGVCLDELIEVQTERLAYGGDAVARHGGLAIFIPLAGPGELLRVRVTEVKKNFARARIEEVLRASPERRVALCQHFGDCGGCQLQHLSYSAQLEAKAGFVRDSLMRVGRIDWPHKIEVRSADEFGYRTRAQVKIERRITPIGAAVNSTAGGNFDGPVMAGDQDDSGRASELLGRDSAGSFGGGSGDAGFRSTLHIGFNREGSHSVCDVSMCPILSRELNSALTDLRSALGPKPDQADPSNAAMPAEVELASGDSGYSFAPRLAGLPSGFVEQSIAGIKYRFGPATFFQGNRFLVEQLMDCALKNEAGDLAVDLYAGAGLFSMKLTTTFRSVIAVESDQEASSYAKKTASANKLSNIEILNQPAEVWTKQSVKRARHTDQPKIDLILLDPPRTGASKIIGDLLELRPARITYVSCDPVTLSRDLSRLVEAYKIESITAFDLFPQTYHVETIAKLVEK
jgi:23S rRNA (uracil1939-C5)-methyltransferase